MRRSSRTVCTWYALRYPWGMSARKQRLTITVDSELVAAARAEVEAGRADSVSAWVGVAIRERAERERKLALLAEAVADFEAEFGEIGDDEITSNRRADRERSRVVRGPRGGRSIGQGRERAQPA